MKVRVLWETMVVEVDGLCWLDGTRVRYDNCDVPGRKVFFDMSVAFEYYLDDGDERRIPAKFRQGLVTDGQEEWFVPNGGFSRSRAGDGNGLCNGLCNGLFNNWFVVCKLEDDLLGERADFVISLALKAINNYSREL